MRRRGGDAGGLGSGGSTGLGVSSDLGFLLLRESVLALLHGSAHLSAAPSIYIASQVSIAKHEIKDRIGQESTEQGERNLLFMDQLIFSDLLISEYGFSWGSPFKPGDDTASAAAADELEAALLAGREAGATRMMGVLVFGARGFIEVGLPAGCLVTRERRLLDMALFLVGGIVVAGVAAIAAWCGSSSAGAGGLGAIVTFLFEL